MEILVFGGTAEGRALVEWLSATDACEIVSCTATEYGGELVEGLPHVAALVGPLDAEAKERLVAAHDFACIVDATHPYATHVTQSVLALAEAHRLPLLRLVREGRDGRDGSCADRDDRPAVITAVADVAEAARTVAARDGRIMLATGVKDLPAFVEAVEGFEERLYVRILPVESSVARARELGIPASHIIAMQGPFSVETNMALLRQFGIEVMVTKASGSTGGFGEKVEAAGACDVELVVIERPEERGGLTFDEVQGELARMLGIPWPEVTDGASMAPASAFADDAHSKPVRQVSLVGIGLGNPDTLTIEAVKAIEASDLLIGASRMLEPYAGHPAEKLALIKSDDIIAALCGRNYRHASVLFSGDVGFYSGATALSQKLADIEGIDVRAIPGISSVVCLCARLRTPWQDVHLVSAHGRECDPVAEVRTHAKTFMLTGGKTKVRDVCALLIEAGLAEVAVYVGERLSYDDERIVSGTAAELAQEDFSDLAVMLVENPAAPKREPGRLETP